MTKFLYFCRLKINNAKERDTMIYKIMPVILFFLTSFTSNSSFISNRSELDSTKEKDTVLIAGTSKINSVSKVENLYYNLNTNDFALPQLESFKRAIEGFYLLKEKGIIKKDILTLIDFSLSANKKRLWVIDMTTNTVLYQTLVSHGRNTGEEFANKFSNKVSSYQSSLGFYATSETYSGKHGLSLRLDGLEKGVNDNARNRAIVVHGANYVGDSFIKNNGRLGRSEGCPAIPMELRDDIIETIKGKSCLFIYHPSGNKQLPVKLLS